MNLTVILIILVPILFVIGTIYAAIKDQKRLEQGKLKEILEKREEDRNKILKKIKSFIIDYSKYSFKINDNNYKIFKFVFIYKYIIKSRLLRSYVMNYSKLLSVSAFAAFTLFSTQSNAFTVGLAMPTQEEPKWYKEGFLLQDKHQDKGFTVDRF